MPFFSFSLTFCSVGTWTGQKVCFSLIMTAYPILTSISPILDSEPNATGPSSSSKDALRLGIRDENDHFYL